MMPEYVCKDCGKVLCGWGARYMINSGRRYLCPECEGTLDEKREPGSAACSTEKKAGKRTRAA